MPSKPPTPNKLYGIFGDAQWTNKDRLSDAMLRNLIEHFSTLELTLANLPEDELGQGYEYLIKKFADDSGHTAAEFYTNRTVVHLMTEMLEPMPSESIYDPTCGSGGMLLSSITHLRRQGLEWRNVKLYGQERNLMTSSIARMNCFLHGIEDFQIVRGDTLSEPKLIQGDRLMQFDVVLANPPYSIKQWDRDAFASDPWGRNLYGTPPQGRADYAFWQHILCSLIPKTGRCAILFPHGVLFRQEEADMRRKLIEADVIECVLGLGPNLFYNSPMEACVVICRTAKPKAHKGKILFINAVDEVTRERAQSLLTDDHIERVVKAYKKFKDEPGFTRVATLEEIRKQGGNLSISLYVAASEATSASQPTTNGYSVGEAVSGWLGSASEVRQALHSLIKKQTQPTELPAPSTVFSMMPAWIKRTEWKRLPFGAFVDSVNERVEPANAAEEIYVGLDDLDPGSLHIQRWGKGSDVIGTKLRFRKGDLIFGRRRAYQRKLAVAEMKGICSAHAMVVRAKPDVVLPEFLPFFMMSDRFMNRAVEISVGSLSPTINWTTLKLQEFDLPPLDQQRRIAEILWAVDEVIVENGSLGDCIASTRAAYVAENLVTSDAWQAVRADVFCASVRDGTHDSPKPVPDGRRLITSKHLLPFGIDFDTAYRIAENDYQQVIKRSKVDQWDVLLGMIGTIGKPVLVENPDPEFAIKNIALFKFDGDEGKARWMLTYLQSPAFDNEVAKHSTGNAQKFLSLGLLRGLLIPNPPEAERKAILDRIGRYDEAATTCRDSLQKGHELRSVFLTQIFFQ